MRVVLSTIGKFWSFDLARQMQKRRALTAIFSGYPWFKLKSEGIPKQKVHRFPYLHAPYMRFAPCFRSLHLVRSWEWKDSVTFDRYVARHLPACDIFSGLSGSALHSGRVAKHQGAKYVCDRGSSHIRVQDRILQEEYDRSELSFSGIDHRVIGREEAEYETADVITVPSTFALDTFVESGIPRRKLRLVPYGVDIDTFYPCAPRTENKFQVLFVGSVSVRKGVRYLLEAFRQLECRSKHLVIAGLVSQEMENTIKRVQNCSWISLLGHVGQKQLREIMSTSQVMVLPSVEDGFGLVQAQAMACGCPVIASRNTGAQDLFTDGKEGFIVPIADSGAIRDRLQTLADNPDLRGRMSEAALQRVKSMGGWDQYGERIYRIFSESLGF
jgi:alpha-maltose-1-phosphate synthase